MVCPWWLSFILYNPVRKFLTDRERILKDSKITKDSLVLEVGAGNGFITEIIAEKAKKVVAIELQEKFVKALNRRLNKFGAKVEIRLGDIANISLEQQYYDVVICYYSFHEIAKKEKAAEIIAFSIKKNGTLSLYEPTIEVGKDSMDKLIARFRNLNFIEEMRKDTFFTRIVIMRKQ